MPKWRILSGVPFFFAWQWMANIQSHGGPLPKQWIDDLKKDPIEFNILANSKKDQNLKGRLFNELKFNIVGFDIIYNYDS